MPANKFNFTQNALDALPLPEKGKRDYYKDAKEPGLILDVRPTGTKSFYLYKKINGKPERVYLGPYPDLKIPEARAKAIEKKNEIAKGHNPQEEKRKIRQEITLGDFFQDYLENYSKVYKRSWQSDINEYNGYLAHWKNRKLSNISKPEVQKLHEYIGRNNGIYMANRVLDRVRGIYSKAIEWGWEGDNPAKGIRKFKEQARERFIQPDELPLFFEALGQEENETARHFIMLALMTGQRRANVLAMRWNEINWARREWHIPESKNGESITVPLIDQAMELLQERKDKVSSQWVFPGDTEDKHFKEPKKAWDRIRKRATLALWRQEPELDQLINEVEADIQQRDNYGYTIMKLFREIQEQAEERGIELPTGLMDLRFHDIRRTMGSYQAITGASLPIIGKALGHKSPQSTQVYARLHNDPVRHSMENAADAMLNLKGTG